MCAHHLPRVVYWNNMPAPYVVGRFNALADRGNLEFEAWFSEVRGADRSWGVDETEWRFRGRYISARRLAGRTLHLPIAELRTHRPDVFVSGYDQPEFALGSPAARALAARTAFRVLPTYDAWSERAWWREFGKHLLFHSIDGAEVSGADAVTLAYGYGLPAERTTQTTQSIDVAHYRQARAVNPTTRAARRAELQLHGCVFVYVGRLWSGKGLDYLLEAYRLARATQPDMSLLLIGDGIDEARYRAQARDLPGVVFAGFVQPRNLPDYYALGDVLVFPTLGDPYGLVVPEAMAAGLPVICTEAAGDIRRRLPDGQAGYIVPPADATTLADRMCRLASDSSLTARMAVAASQLALAHTHEAWAIDFERCVGELLATPPRHTPAALLLRGIGQLMVLASGRQAPAPYVHGGIAHVS